MSCEKQNSAFKSLFLAILTENGYYEELRKFMNDKGYEPMEMAIMLYHQYEKAPDGISPYYYMDSLEDTLAQNRNENFEDVREIVEFVWDNMLWKE